MRVVIKLRLRFLVNLSLALLSVWLLTHPGRPKDIVYTIESTAFFTVLIMVLGRSAIHAVRQLRLRAN
jgi:hypothetical protein